MRKKASTKTVPSASKRWSIPKSVLVLGKTIPVFVQKLMEKPDEKLHGYYEAAEGIYVAEGMSEEETWTTLFHEMMHAALEISGLRYSLFKKDEQEEALVRMLEHYMYPLVDKKKLIGTVRRTKKGG